MHGKSPSITTDRKSKLIDLVIRIELTRAIFMPRFSNYLKNSTIHFRLFLYLVTCFLKIMVSLLFRLQAVSKIYVPIYPYLISEGDEIVRPCDRHSNETMTLRKHVTKYKHTWIWMFEFLRKFENRCIKDYFSSYPLINQFILILFGVEGPLCCWHF